MKENEFAVKENEFAVKENEFAVKENEFAVTLLGHHTFSLKAKLHLSLMWINFFKCLTEMKENYASGKCFW